MQFDLLIPKPLMITIALVLTAAFAHLLAGNNETPLVQWQQKTIRVDDRSRWNYSTQVAISKWNQAGVGVGFVLTDQDADVIIEETSDFMSGCKKKGTVGCSKIGRNNLFGQGQKLQLRPKPAGLIDHGQMSSVVAHELGHVLGLRHPARPRKQSDACVLMSPNNDCRRQVEMKMIIHDSSDSLSTQASSINYYHNQGRLISFKKTHHLICGPSNQEIKLLRHWYDGPGPNRRSWDPECRFNEKDGQAWKIATKPTG